MAVIKSKFKSKKHSRQNKSNKNSKHSKNVSMKKKTIKNGGGRGRKGEYPVSPKKSKKSYTIKPGNYLAGAPTIISHKNLKSSYKPSYIKPFNRLVSAAIHTHFNPETKLYHTVTFQEQRGLLGRKKIIPILSKKGVTGEQHKQNMNLKDLGKMEKPNNNTKLAKSYNHVGNYEKFMENLTRSQKARSNEAERLIKAEEEKNKSLMRFFRKKKPEKKDANTVEVNPYEDSRQFLITNPEAIRRSLKENQHTTYANPETYDSLPNKGKQDENIYEVVKHKNTHITNPTNISVKKLNLSNPKTSNTESFNLQKSIKKIDFTGSMVQISNQANERKAKRANSQKLLAEVRRISAKRQGSQNANTSFTNFPLPLPINPKIYENIYPIKTNLQSESESPYSRLAPRDLAHSGLAPEPPNSFYSQLAPRESVYSSYLSTNHPGDSQVYYEQVVPYYEKLLASKGRISPTRPKNSKYGSDSGSNILRTNSSRLNFVNNNVYANLMTGKYETAA